MPLEGAATARPLDRTIRAVADLEKASLDSRTGADRSSDLIGRVAGSARSLVLHAALFRRACS